MYWEVWAALFVKSAVILGSGEAFRRGYQRAPAACRHGILLVALGLLALLPLLSPLLPPLHLPVLPSPGRLVAVSTETATFLVAHRTRSGAPDRTTNWPLLIWAGGALLALGPVIVGSIVLARMDRRAVPLRDPAWTDLARELSSMMGMRRTPELLCVRAPVMPLAWGLRRPRILLPSACAGWTAARRRIVLMHELAHIERRDIATQMFVRVIAALWWFQPLVWTTSRGLRRESEHACDALAIASGIRPSEYSAELLDIARGLRWRGLWSLTAVAMARRSNLEGRLVAILGPQPLNTPRTRLLAPFALLTALTMAASAVTFTPRVHHSGDIAMKRAFLPGLLASAGLSAATVGGSIYDPSGGAIPAAKVSLYRGQMENSGSRVCRAENTSSASRNLALPRRSRDLLCSRMRKSIAA